MLKLNGEEIKVTMFPDGTSQVWKIDESLVKDTNTITWEFSNEGELIHLVQLVDLIRHLNPESLDLTLNISYFPYARQDKIVTNKSTFALRSFMTVLNSLTFTRIDTKDIHSSLPKKLSNALFTSDDTTSNVVQLIRNNNYSLACPDFGASLRYSGGPPIIGHKVRDQETGYITEYKIEGDPKDKDILIRDDICDGGMTFILMAKELYKQGAKSVHLYVTHGIFSKGLKPLKEAGIQRTFTHKGEVGELKTGLGKSIIYQGE